jgi:hypothetical protein
MDLNDLTKNPEQIKSLIGVLQQLLDLTENKNDSNTTDEQFVSPIKTKNKRSSSPRQPNKFLEMQERELHKEDKEVDKRLSKFPPVARARPFEMIDVVCRVCGKKETISPSLLFEAVDRYKCNNCSTQAG